MDDITLFLTLVAAALALVFLVLWRRRKPGRAQKVSAKSWVLVDGSNVMHWQDQTPSLEPVKAVVELLIAQGQVPGVVFDANAGWKLRGRYLHDGELARLIGLASRQVLVVEKGTPADPFLLQTAREFRARIVTNDRYRDWADKHPEVLEPGFLIRGGIREGKVWLQGVEQVVGAL
jgi:Zc3h12a-like Ribonuclease NYN domain